MFCTKNTIIYLVLEVANPSVAPSLGRFQNDDKMTSNGAPIEVIEVPDDDSDDFPNSGPQKPAEAQDVLGQNR